jgi:D-alanyl-lipoteichoic acid acyltransferase DltB (MBOAT superfamily)
MNFSAYFIALSIILVVILYYLIPGRLQNGLLLFGSYTFIIFWNWHFALILFLVTGFHYAYGIWLSKHRQKLLLVLGVAANMLALLFFRSADYFVPQLVTLFKNLGLYANWDSLEVVVPIGLSYYTLQNISYLVDIYRKQTLPVFSLVNFALYQAYFPKLLAGPIEYARTFIPKLEKNRVVGNEDLAKSITLILTGMVRKLVIADSLSSAIPAEIFNTPAFFSPIDLFGWLIVYAFVIYNDFAGYTSVARGISGLFGIELSNNFDYPYFARSFSEFWNRWHITLSHWLRDYIYFPLHRALLHAFPARNNLLTLILPPLVTMLASGLWHGFSWNMIVWGGLHGIYLVVERMLSLGKQVVPPEQKPFRQQLLANGLIFLLVILAWVPFRMELPIAVEYWISMLNLTNFSISSRKLLLILPYLGLWVAVEWQFYRYRDEFLAIKFPKWAQALAFAGVFVLILIASADQSSPPFIYQGF